MTADQPEDPLQTPSQFIRGVGPARAELLARLNLQTVGDLLFNIPRDILDLTRVVPAFELKPDLVQTVFGIVVDRDAKETSTGKTMVAVLLRSDGGFVRGVWFNQPYMFRRFELGQRVLFSGKPKFTQRRWEFSHPHLQFLGEDEGETTGGLLPRYGLTEGLKQHEMRRLMRNVVEDFADKVPELLPESFRQRASIPEIKQAITQIHLPRTMEEYEAGRRRVLFDDLLEFQLGLAMRRRMWRKQQRSAPLLNSAKALPKDYLSMNAGLPLSRTLPWLKRLNLLRQLRLLAVQLPSWYLALLRQKLTLLTPA